MLPETTKTNVMDFHPIVQAMLRDSAERWLATKDRSARENAITICIEPPRAFVLTHNRYLGIKGWVCDEGVLGGFVLSEFFAAFGSSYALWLESKLGGQYPVRGFMKDGDREWTFSVDAKDGK